MTEIKPKKENVVAEIRLLLTKKEEKYRLQVEQQGNIEGLSKLTEVLINSEDEFATRTLIATMSTIVECYCKNKGIKNVSSQKKLIIK